MIDLYNGYRRWKYSTLVTTLVILGLLALVPLMMNPLSSKLDFMIFAVGYVMMALGLNIVVGFAGLLDLGYVAFYAIGAYTVGWFASDFFSNANGGKGIHIGVASSTCDTCPPTTGIHLNFLLLVVAAMILCAIAGVVIGLPTLRLRGDYIAIVTLAFGEIVHTIAENGDKITIPIIDHKLTNGPTAISPVDQPKLPGIDQFDSALNLRPYFWLGLGMLAVILFINFRLRDSRLGRAWIAIREDEVAAASMGVPLVKVKLLAYGSGAAIGGAAGVFLGSYNNAINSNQFQFFFSILILSMIIVGGLGNIWGVVAGGVLLSFIDRYLIPDVLDDVPSKLGLDFRTSELNFAIFGFLLVLVMVLRPEGLFPEGRRKIKDLHESAAVEEMESSATTPDKQPAAPVEDAILEAVDVSKIFGGLVAVDGVDFAIPRKSIVSIIGPNGAGKTTFFNMLTGLYRPSTGGIWFEGKDITAMRPDKIMGLGISRTFQNIRLFPTISAAVENVMVAEHRQMKAGIFRSIFRPPGTVNEEREGREKAREILEFVGLPKRAFEEMSINMSYGDQRRLEIARALAGDPTLLLLDEPTAGMNPQESAQLTEFMQRLRDERDLTILLIEHDMRVMGVSERITVLDHGTKIAEGEPAEVRANPRVVEAYLGKQESSS